MIVSICGEITLTSAAVYTLLSDRDKARVELIAVCPSVDMAVWLRSRLPRWFDVGDLIVMGGPRERN